MRRSLVYLLFIFCANLSCSQQQLVDDIDNIPQTVEGDKPYANVFQPLDGTWKGKFIIYEDTNLRPKHEVELEAITIDNLQREGLKQVNAIEVEQIYSSKTPYFQKVTITDFYPETGSKVISMGVNKIQDGKMWCVVRKPDETVIHDGELQGNTIIWSRNEISPQRKEYFRETVLANSYEIIGWGYYDGDNPKLSPKLWFYAKYQRQ